MNHSIVGISKPVNELQSSYLPDRLVEVALSGLVQMYNAERQLFCFRTCLVKDILVQEGLSFRYSMISLIGLRQFELAGNHSPIHIQETLDKILQASVYFTNIGDVGLVLWLSAITRPDYLNKLFDRLQLTNALSHFPDALSGLTTELSWFLMGLAEAKKVLGKEFHFANVAESVFKIIKGNYFNKGLFSHQQLDSFYRRLRGKFGCFADQVYPILALTNFYQAFGAEEALQIASQCAKKICYMQGPLGQWWWHYNALNGETSKKYPVYSTHQNGMAPMALHALGKITGEKFYKEISKGLDWIIGKNEIGIDLIDYEKKLIWRGIESKNFQQYRALFKRFEWLFGNKIQKNSVGSTRNIRLQNFGDDFQAAGIKPGNSRLAVNIECRPYHFGWILYAWNL